MSEPIKHLWEYEHPYAATPGNFYMAGEERRYASLAEWAAWNMTNEGQRDPTLNHIWRWDWEITYDKAPGDARHEYTREVHTLHLFWVALRKARLFSHHIAVTPDDEPAVRELLQQHAEVVRRYWLPFLEGTTVTPSTASGA